MLTQKIECQLKLSISIEPIKGPSAAPSPAPSPKNPNTFGRRFSETTCRIMAMLFGVSNAPPTACNARKTINRSRLGERAQPRDANRNRPTPHKYIVLLPYMSPSFPAIGCVTAITIK